MIDRPCKDDDDYFDPDSSIIVKTHGTNKTSQEISVVRSSVVRDLTFSMRYPVFSSSMFVISSSSIGDYCVLIDGLIRVAMLPVSVAVAAVNLLISLRVVSFVLSGSVFLTNAIFRYSVREILIKKLLRTEVDVGIST